MLNLNLTPGGRHFALTLELVMVHLNPLNQKLETFGEHIPILIIGIANF